MVPHTDQTSDQDQARRGASCGSVGSAFSLPTANSHSFSSPGANVLFLKGQITKVQGDILLILSFVYFLPEHNYFMFITSMC